MKAKIIFMPKLNCLVTKSLYLCSDCGYVLLDIASYINEFGIIPTEWHCSCRRKAKKVFLFNSKKVVKEVSTGY